MITSRKLQKFSRQCGIVCMTNARKEAQADSQADQHIHPLPKKAHTVQTLHKRKPA